MSKKKDWAPAPNYRPDIDWHLTSALLGSLTSWLANQGYHTENATPESLEKGTLKVGPYVLQLKVEIYDDDKNGDHVTTRMPENLLNALKMLARQT